jgi:hypothetical protein
MINVAKHGFVVARAPQFEQPLMSDKNEFAKVFAKEIADSWPIFKDCKYTVHDGITFRTPVIKIDVTFTNSGMTLKASVEIMATGFHELLLNTDANVGVNFDEDATIAAVKPGRTKAIALLKRQLFHAVNSLKEEVEAIEGMLK